MLPKSAVRAARASRLDTVQRRALALLFSVLALALAAIGADALAGGRNAARVIVGVAALALAAWMGTLAWSAARRGR